MYTQQQQQKKLTTTQTIAYQQLTKHTNTSHITNTHHNNVISIVTYTPYNNIMSTQTVCVNPKTTNITKPTNVNATAQHTVHNNTPQTTTQCTAQVHRKHIIQKTN